MVRSSSQERLKQNLGTLKILYIKNIRILKNTGAWKGPIIGLTPFNRYSTFLTRTTTFSDLFC